LTPLCVSHGSLLFGWLSRRRTPPQFQNKFYALGHGDSVKFEPFSFALLKEAEAEAA